MRYTKFLLAVSVVFILAVAAPSLMRMSHIQAQDDAEPIVITAGDYRVQFNKLWFADEMDGENPEHGKFLVFDITLYNDHSSRVCFHDKNFTVEIEGLGKQHPEKHSEARDEFFQGRDFPGGFLGQCIDEGESQLSLLEYDIPVDTTTITFYFSPEKEETVATLALASLPTTDDSEDLLDLSAIQITFTPTPTPTATFTASPTPMPTATHTATSTQPEPTATTRPSATPRPTSTPRRTSTPATTVRYISANSNVNVRACPSTSCDVVAVLAPGSAIVVLSSDSGWYEIVLDDGREAYVANFLTSASEPAAQSQSQPAAPAQPAQPAPTQQPSAPQPTQQPAAPAQSGQQQQSQPQPAQPDSSEFTCDCSKSCTAMASCQEAYFQLSCGCTERDGNGDGVPCESLCGG